jgi:hypothetical protein
VKSLTGPLVYQVTTTDDVLLIDTTLGPVDVQLLAANTSLIFSRKLIIKDAFGTVSPFLDITLLPAGGDTIDGALTTSVFFTIGVYGSLEIISNQNNGYNII